MRFRTQICNYAVKYTSSNKDICFPQYQIPVLQDQNLHSITIKGQYDYMRQISSMNMIIYQLEHTDNLEFHLNYINMIIWNNQNIHDYFNQNNFYSHIITIIENKALEKLNIQ